MKFRNVSGERRSTRVGGQRLDRGLVVGERIGDQLSYLLVPWLDIALEGLGTTAIAQSNKNTSISDEHASFGG